MIYKCTSDQCQCRVVQGKEIAGGWKCMVCGTEFIRRYPAPVASEEVLDRINRLLAEFQTLDALTQVEVVQMILEVHARALGKAGLPFFELSVTDLFKEWTRGSLDRVNHAVASTES